jgi:hypothetical protein
LNAGESALVAAGSWITDPPLLGNVGSGKLGTPCLRMHCALVIAASFWLSGSGNPSLLPPGSSFLHDCWADWNAGDCLSRLEGLKGSPFAGGSGKFGTPCDRMQVENLSLNAYPLDAPVPVAPLGVPEDPQAAIVSVQHRAASAINRPWRAPFGSRLIVALSMAWDTFGLVGGFNLWQTR